MTEEELRTVVILTARMCYGIQGADPKQPAMKEQGIQAAVGTLQELLSKQREEMVKRIEKAFKEGQKDILNQFIGEIEKHKSNQKDVVLKTTEFRELVYKNLDQLTKEL